MNALLDTRLFGSALVTIFVIMDPPGAVPIFIALTVLALAVHSVAFAIPGRAWTNHKAPVVAVEAPAVAATPAG